MRRAGSEVIGGPFEGQSSEGLFNSISSVKSRAEALDFSAVLAGRCLPGFFIDFLL